MIGKRDHFINYALLAILISGALMQFSALRIYGVAPNLLLVCLVVSSFFIEQILSYAFLVLLASILARTTGGAFDPFAVTLTVIGLAVFWLQRRLVVRGLIGVSILIVLATLCLYATISPTILLQHPGIMTAEIIYNLIVGFAFFELADRFFGKSAR